MRDDQLGIGLCSDEGSKRGEKLLVVGRREDSLKLSSNTKQTSQGRYSEEDQDDRNNVPQ
jgi:hypothetical protein